MNISIIKITLDAAGIKTRWNCFNQQA